MEQLLYVLAMLLLLPFMYTYNFLLVELPRRYGYVKFIVIIISYVLLLSVMTVLLSAGTLPLTIYFFTIIGVQVVGVWILRDSLMERLSRLFNRDAKH